MNHSIRMADNRCPCVSRMGYSTFVLSPSFHLNCGAVRLRPLFSTRRAEFTTAKNAGDRKEPGATARLPTSTVSNLRSGLANMQRGTS